jgi:hypothetical protein
MRLRRKLGILAVTGVIAASLAVATAGIASAAGAPGRLRLTGSCGEFLDLTERTPGTLIVTLTIPDPDPSEVWNFTAQEQQYGAVTGARLGNPVSITPNPMPQFVFSLAEGGFTTTANFDDQPGLTHGFSYVATRTSPTPLTCANEGFWTNPGNGVAGPTAENPASRPDSPPALTGATEADAGANDVALQFDQEMLATPQGIPANTRFSVLVNGVARTVTGVSVINDSPPLDALVDVTFDGLPLTAGQTVSVQYRKQLTASLPQLQDLEGKQTASFGPISVPAF